ncbi:efflux RND transporter permease subunit, partial [Myxococcota bacterium]|nr:efflux RND transporter permease subunit [Myxococcota bacterium]
MSLTKIGVNRPTATIIFFLAITLMGLVSIGFLNLDLMPKLELPMITVFTPYPGAGPKEVEKNVTKIMEEQLAVVSGVDKITSKSEENISIISIGFDWETTLSDAANDIRDKLGLVKRNLPEGAEEPFLFKMDLSMMPVLIFSIQCAPENYARLRQYAEDNIVTPLKKINGVAQAQLIGGIKREIRVEIDRRRMEEAGVSYDAVKGLIASANVTVPGGNTTVNDTTFLLRVPGEMTAATDLNSLVVGMNPRTGAVVYLRDVATIRDTTNEQTYFAEGPTGPSIMVMVQKQSSANTVKVASKVLKKIKSIQKTLRKDVKIVIIRDFSINIVRTIDNLVNV